MSLKARLNQLERQIKPKRSGIPQIRILLPDNGRDSNVKFGGTGPVVIYKREEQNVT